MIIGWLKSDIRVLMAVRILWVTRSRQGDKTEQDNRQMGRSLCKTIYHSLSFNYCFFESLRYAKANECSSTLIQVSTSDDHVLNFYCGRDVN